MGSRSKIWGGGVVGRDTVGGVIVWRVGGIACL